MKNKREIGITLVALVVTIIILLILTGITISQLTGSGLFEKAKLAKEKYENAQKDEEEKLNQIYSQLSVGSNRDSELPTTLEDLYRIIDERTRQNQNPTGTIIAYSVNNVPDGYLECNGQEVSRTTYAKLFSIIGTTYGEGDGSTTFKVPDLRGEFLRGTGTNTHENQGSGEEVGTHQNATISTNLYLNREGYFFTFNRTGADKTGGNYDYKYEKSGNLAYRNSRISKYRFLVI